MAAFAPIVPFLLIASTAMTVVGQIQSGQAADEVAKMQAQNAQVVADRNALIARDQANYSAARQREQAGQEEAASQRAAQIKREQTKVNISNARAEAGASGAGVYDPTMLDITGDIAGKGELDALTSLYEGKSAASILRSQAGLTEYEGRNKSDMLLYQGAQDASLIRYQGKVAKQKSYMDAAATAIGGMSSVAGKYAPKSETWASGQSFRTGGGYG